jgi:hypothetical protein
MGRFSIVGIHNRPASGQPKADLTEGVPSWINLTAQSNAPPT